MTKANDRHAGTNPGAIGGQARKINNWMSQAKWLDDKDRLVSVEMETLRDHIDPTVPAKVNYRDLKDKLGLKTQSDAQEIDRNADDQERDRARRALWDNVEAIDAGEKSQLVDDIADEYGRAFVESELDRARVDLAGVERDQELGAPEPVDVNPSSTAEANGPTVTAEPARAAISPADDGRPSPDRTPVTASAAPDAEPRAAPRERDYTGVAGLIRLAVDVVRSEYRVGIDDASPSGQTTIEAYL
jgi:hypothetical protein